MKEPKPLIGQIGRDADHPENGDAQFYEWISGPSEKPAAVELFLHLIDDLKTETDVEIMRSLVSQWQTDCDPEEFQIRLKALHQLMPTSHPFFVIEKEFKQL